MKQVLYNYDVYPKVFLGDQEKTITIQPLGDHAAFEPDFAYTVRVFKVNQSNPGCYPERSGRSVHTVKPDADGCLRVTAYFEGEGEHFINVYKESDLLSPIHCTLSVYSLAEDMAGRIPLRGDLHLHTRRSDGRESPAITCANYRGHGYDFTVISDHHRYYPSLEAMQFYGDRTDLAIIPGEEVHVPHTTVHYVNFGGTYSINALITPNPNQEKGGDAPEFRSLDGNAPETLTQEEFAALITERAKEIPLEYESERMSTAAINWVYEQIQKNGGLGIFPHPFWLCQMMHLSEEYTEYLYKTAPFDAFEVLGGENYYQHNGFQTALYYDMRMKGYDPPVVGSTDSHCSTEHNRNALICSTIVFAKENTREALIDAIKEKYSVAVDTISTEYRLVGDYRWVKYGSFLLENYFPVHDLACQAEGYYMKQYAVGDKRAEKILADMKGQIPQMQKKYFDL